MKTAIRLIRRVLSGQLPAQALSYSALNKLNAWLRTGSKRFEFERLYLENADPWDFHRSSYEQQKYKHVLASILRYRKGSQSVLEIGCSIGIFTKILSAQFGEIVAVDVAQAAIRHAKHYCRPCANIRFLKRDLRDLRLRRTFDVIVCAEVVYYVHDDFAPRVCQVLREHLAPSGIIVLVGENKGISSAWEARLKAAFKTIQTETTDDPARPYRITILGSPNQP